MSDEGLLLSFKKIAVRWVQFVPPVLPNQLPELTAYGEIISDNSDVLPRTVTNWDGVSDECKAELVAALARLMIERAAHELNTTPDRIEMTGQLVQIKSPDDPTP